MIQSSPKLRYSLYAMLACVIFLSCADEKYPIYSLETIEYIPDSLKEKHRAWIMETVRAASQHMTGGDYEHADRTIRQASHTADELFQSKVVGLRKQINDEWWDDLKIKPNEMSDAEKLIFDSLLNAR